MALTKITGSLIAANTITAENIVSDISLGGDTSPRITSISYPGDDTAADTAGGQTITINGANFANGAAVYLDMVAVGSATVVNANTITITSPAKATGSYVLYVINTDGGTAIHVPGVQYSGVPLWTTGAGSIGTAYETKAYSNTVVATGDTPITYSLVSGTLPTGATLAANGQLSGTADVTEGSTTYNFTIRATDAQNQDTDRAFSLTLSSDVVTWVSPANDASIALAQDAASTTTLNATSAAGYSVSYTANTLPAGLSISGSSVTGTPTVSGNTTSLLTATAATTNRTATRTVTWVISVASDTYWPHVTSLLSSNVVTAPFNKDTSNNNFAIAVNGNAQPHKSSPLTPGHYSAFFDGTGDYIQFNPITLSADFTVEAWIYKTDTDTSGYTVLFSSTNSDLSLEIDRSTVGSVAWYMGGGYLGTGTTGASYITPNSWYHVAWVREGSSCRIYVNGIQRGVTVTNSTSTNISLMGTYISGGYEFNGYISNVRVATTCLYPGGTSFTPSTTPLTAVSGTQLLMCQSTRFIDSSPNNTALTVYGQTYVSSFAPFEPNPNYATYGSTNFDGSGDFLSLTGTSAIQFGSGDFTIECWVYPRSSSGAIYGDRSATNFTGMVIVLSSYFVGLLMSQGTIWDVNTYSSPAGTPLIANSWTHVAVVRSGTNINVYTNGVLNYTRTFTGSLAQTSTVRIGSEAGDSAAYNGYISNFRIVKGTAVYTSAFTPPTAPLTAIANTGLLTCQTNQPINNNTFLDSSTNGLPLTGAGNVTQGTLSPYGENWSNYFDGTGDYLSIVSTNALNFGTGDFTVEFWVNFSNAAAAIFFFVDARNASQTNAWVLNRNTSNQLQWFSGQVLQLTSVTTISTTNVWHHVAITRSSGILQFWINGIDAGGSGADTINYNINSTPLIVGSRYNGQDYLNGYISNLRIVKGTALYTSNFTPSTTPLQPIAGTVLLTCKDNAFVDDSPNNFTITRNGDVSAQKFGPFAGTTLPTPYYSAYFDGSGDSLSVPSNTAFALGTGDFTIECWLYYIVGGSGGRFIIDSNNASNMLFRYNVGATLEFYANSSLKLSYTVSLANAWNHVAVTRSGSAYRLFLNGALVATGTGTENISSSANPTIGSQSGNSTSDNFSGYISNLRVIKGTAVYTSVFTPPTTPLTAITNTSLLTCQSSTFVDNSTNNFTVTATGNTRPTTFSPFPVTYSTGQSYTPAVFGGSMYFDGTGDGLTFSTTSALNFGTGDFTVEAWVNLSAKTTRSALFGAIATGAMDLQLVTPSDVIAVGRVNTAYDFSTTYSFTVGRWTHVAIARSGSTIRCFVDGILLNSATNTQSYGQNNGTGTIGHTNNEHHINGYVADLRFVRGRALYTSSFVPQNRPLTAVKDTTLLLNGTGAAIYDSSSMRVLETVGNAQLNTAVTKYGSSSMYFDGTGDSAKYLITNDVNLGTGDFTIEGWSRLTATGDAYRTIFGQTHNTSKTLTIRYGNNGYGQKLQVGVQTDTLATTWSCSATQTTHLNQWVHIAFTRSSGVCRLFVNGVLQSINSGANPSTYPVTSFTDNTSIINTSVMNVGADSYTGYISDFRITRGVARYTATFTPPTTALLDK